MTPPFPRVHNRCSSSFQLGLYIDIVGSDINTPCDVLYDEFCSTTEIHSFSFPWWCI